MKKSKNGLMDSIKIPFRTKVQVLNEMTFINLITELGYREDNYWTDDDEEILHKLLKLADEHTEVLMEKFRKNMSDIRWHKCNQEKGQGMPTETGTYFVCRKDGKIHKEMFNGTGWAYNGKVIQYWAKFLNPITEEEHGRL